MNRILFLIKLFFLNFHWLNHPKVWDIKRKVKVVGFGFQGTEDALLAIDIFCGGWSGVEELGVVLDVIAHEGVDEEVAVVVALREETRLQGLEL